MIEEAAFGPSSIDYYCYLFLYCVSDHHSEEPQRDLQVPFPRLLFLLNVPLFKSDCNLYNISFAAGIKGKPTSSQFLEAFCIHLCSSSKPGYFVDFTLQQRHFWWD
ncbi:hypothetical protein HHK36_008760 [Tetracentron sinense]|uniref:Uncharacterized protein n=1 Tax=Tetracentron sinense TaxID=13715 RepID=A0A834ZG35_TETSI|nr:hypothetical protein HHK36_008760 [Tetracentron sinense]